MDGVLNWLWQGSVVAVAVHAWLRWSHSSPARSRYIALWVAMALVLVMPALPVLSRAEGPMPPGAGAGGELAAVTIPAGWWSSGVIVTLLWSAWVLINGARLVASWLALRRVRAAAVELPPARATQLRFWQRCAGSGRRATLQLSDDVASAAVLGGRVPSIAIAPHVYAQLTDDELDRVIVHEWVHVQRRDDIANAVQVFVHMIAGWHPAVMWLGRRLRLEREMACDDAVVDLTGSPKEYAACLARLASLPGSSLLVVAAVSPSMVGRRIVRILSRERLSSSPSWTMSALGGLALCLLSVGIGTFRFVQSESPRPVAGNAAAPVVESVTAPVGTPTASRAEQVVLPVVAPVRVREGSARGAGNSEPQGVGVPQSWIEISDEVSFAVEPSANALPIPAPPIEPQVPVAAVQSQPLPAAPPDEGSLEVQSPPQLLTDGTTSVVQSPPVWSVAVDAGAAVGRSSRAAGTTVGRGSQDAGAAIGRRSQDAATATAGFFSRISKRIAGSF